MSTKSAAIALGLFVSACASAPNGNPPPDPMPMPRSGMARVRVVHASPDAPAVDVWAKGVEHPLLTNLRYGDTSAYLALDAGTYDIQVRKSPSTINDNVVFDTGDLAIPSGAKISAVAAGFVSSNAQDSRFRILPILEKAATDPDKINLHVVHACADAPTVSIEINGFVNFPTVPRWSDGTDLLQSGKALAVGIDANGGRVTSFTTPTLPEGDLLVVATGSLALPPWDAGAFSLLAIGPNGTIGFIKQDPIVYALHASPDAPAVDAFAGPAKLVDNLVFTKMSKPIQVPPGAYTIDFFAHTEGTMRPAGMPAASQPTGMLAAGERYLAVATGFLASQPSFRLLAVQERFAQGDAMNARVRAVHASPDAPAVDVGVATNAGLSPVVFSQLAFGNSTAADGASVGAGMATLGVAPAGQDKTVLYKIPVTLSGGDRIFAVAAGAATKNVKFRILAVQTSTSPWQVAEVLAQ